MSKVISKHPDVKFHFYADDTQLFIHLKHKNAKIAFDRLRKYLEDVKLWLCANKQKMNADKTDFIVSPNESRGYLGFSTVTPPPPQRFPFGRDNLKNNLVRTFKFGMWVDMGNATNAIVL